MQFSHAQYYLDNCNYWFNRYLINSFSSLPTPLSIAKSTPYSFDSNSGCWTAAAADAAGNTGLSVSNSFIGANHSYFIRYWVGCYLYLTKHYFVINYLLFIIFEYSICYSDLFEFKKVFISCRKVVGLANSKAYWSCSADLETGHLGFEMERTIGLVQRNYFVCWPAKLDHLPINPHMFPKPGASWSCCGNWNCDSYCC